MPTNEEPRMSDQPAIEIRGVQKHFGRKLVLDGLMISVPAGQTFAFLRRNGAGKTTAIRMLLGLIKQEAGELRVLGQDPQKDPLAVLRQVGYLAEDQAMFGWMRVSEMISFILDRPAHADHSRPGHHRVHLRHGRAAAADPVGLGIDTG